MNAISLNLLDEEQLAEQARARDPVKMVIAIGIFLVAVVTGTGAVLSTFASTRKTEANQLQARWDKMQVEGASQEEGSLQTLRACADDLLAINQSRVLYAPQLALVKSLLPDSVQLSRLGLGLSTETKQTEPDATSLPEGKVRRPARQQVTQRLVLRLDGKAVSKRPEIEVDHFLQSLRTHPVFGEQVDQIRLRSIISTPGGTAADAGLGAALFVIECQYKEQK